MSGPRFVALAIALLAGFAAGPAPAIAAAAPDRIETSLAVGKCVRVRAPVAARYVERDLGAVRCPSPRGFSLWLVSSDTNSWLEVEHDGRRWSGEEVVVYRPGAGMFPNVTGRVIWLRDRAGWQGLVFGVAAKDADERRRLSYVAVGVRGVRLCAIGVFTTRQVAERAVRQATNCVEEGGDTR